MRNNPSVSNLTARTDGTDDAQQRFNGSTCLNQVITDTLELSPFSRVDLMNIHRYLIHSYRICTLPWRRWMLSRLKRQGAVPVGILFYHRVGNDHLNPWTITNHRFVEQIDWLEKNFDLVSLAEAQKRIQSGANRRPTVSITFDDGYADNCIEALPMLIRRGIPVTYFVTTQNIIQQQPFPHDIDRQQPLETNSVEMLRSLSAAGIEIAAHTKTHPDLGAIQDHGRLYDEVIGGICQLEQAINKKVRYFAFPFGQHENLNEAVFQLCYDHGIKAVCSAYGGWNEIGGDSFHLHRFHGDPKIAYIKNWLTLDPRKRHVDRFSYTLSDSLDTVPVLPSISNQIGINTFSANPTHE